MISHQDGSTDSDVATMRVGLTEVAEASVESRITQAGPVGPVAAPVVGTIAFLIALLPVEAFRTTCTQETTLQRHAGGRKKKLLEMDRQTAGNQGGSSPSWHRSPLTPGGQRQLPVTGSQLAPFLHLQGYEQFLPKKPSEQAVRFEHKRYDHCEHRLHDLVTAGIVYRCGGCVSACREAHSHCRQCRSSHQGSRSHFSRGCIFLRLNSPRRLNCSRGQKCHPNKLETTG